MFYKEVSGSVVVERFIHSPFIHWHVEHSHVGKLGIVLLLGSQVVHRFGKHTQLAHEQVDGGSYNVVPGGHLGGRHTK